MAEYKPPRSASWRFDPKSKAPYRMSRSGLELFVKCPNCFYIDKRLGIGAPPMPSFTLNSAVDHLLKKEFDIHRAKDTTHPLLKKYGVDAKPVKHEKLEVWRNTFRGISTLHNKTNIEFYGGIDDLWINSKGEYVVVDYKATSKEGKITLDDKWKDSYKRQLEIYQWILRQGGFKVSDLGYFVYCNGKKDREAFDGKLEFDVEVIEYKGDSSWIEPALIKAKECLMQDKIPAPSEDCELCRFKQAIKNTESQDRKETDKDATAKKSTKYVPTQLL